MPIPPQSTACLAALLLLGAVTPACAPDQRRITPTTTGSDLRNLPRGRMTPLPFPGSSLARTGRGDSAVITAKTAVEAPIR